MRFYYAVDVVRVLENGEQISVSCIIGVDFVRHDTVYELTVGSTEAEGPRDTDTNCRLNILLSYYN